MNKPAKNSALDNKADLVLPCIALGLFFSKYLTAWFLNTVILLLNSSFLRSVSCVKAWIISCINVLCDNLFGFSLIVSSK